MLYRYFEKGNREVSLLGLGGMRFPELADGHVDEAEAIKMIRNALDMGINYLDTAYTYHGGLSEVIFGKALKDGYREKAIIADKLPIWLIEKEDDIRRIFDEQIQRLDVDTIDMYLIHSIGKEGWEVTKNCNVIKVLEDLRREGRILNIGFSFHDEYDLFKEVIDAYDWDFCQIQLNYVDEDFQAGVKGMKYAASKGIPVVIMEPLKGGQITDAIPDAVQKEWDSSNIKRTPAQWAFRWLARFPEILTILSGMNTMNQLEENIRIFSDEDITNVTDEDLAVIGRVADIYRDLIRYPCTRCGYCMPCPSGVLIPRLVRYCNDWFAFEKNPKIKETYMTWQDESEHASNCIKCGKCEKACPQHLPVMEIMDEIVREFGR